MVASDNTVQDFPQTFRPDSFHRWGPGLFTGIGVAGTASLLASHQTAMLPILGALTIAFFLLFLTANSLKVRIDVDGLTRTWLWGRKTIAWTQIARIEKTRRSLFLLDERNKDLVPVSALSPASRELIAQEAIARARLRRSKEKPKSAAVEIWTRK